MILRIEEKELKKAILKHAGKKMELTDKADVEFCCNHSKKPRTYHARVFTDGKTSLGWGKEKPFGRKEG